MQTRRIDLKDYTVKLPNENAGKPLPGGEGVVPATFDMPYPVKESLIEILMARDNQLSGSELLNRDELARRINNCQDGEILLTEEEWNKARMAIETVRGLSRPDVELVQRILNAEAVEAELEETKP